MNHATLAQLGRFLLGLGLIPDRPPPADDPLRARRQAVLAAAIESLLNETVVYVD